MYGKRQTITFTPIALVFDDQEELESVRHFLATIRDTLLSGTYAELAGDMLDALDAA